MTSYRLPNLDTLEQLLKKEFQKIDSNHDNFLTKEELFTHLDAWGNDEFDRNVGLQLYERMDKNHDGRVSIDEFIKVFIEAVEILHNKIETCLKYISDYKQSREQAIIKWEEVKKMERLTDNEIMDGSFLTLYVLEAAGLKPLDQGKTSDPYVVAECENQKHTTKVVHRTVNPVWNEHFQFKINSGQSQLLVQIFDEDSDRQEFEGQTIIDMGKLSDQYKHDEWYELHDNRGSKLSGKIHLVCQWIHSKVKYYNEVINKWNEHIRIYEEDLKEYEHDLDALYKPFPMLGAKKFLQSEKNKEKPRVTHPKIDQNSLSAFFIPSSVSWTGAMMHQHTQTSYTTGLCWMMFSLLVSYYRPMFLDLMLSAAYIGSHVLPELRLNALKMKVAFLSILISLILDIIWGVCNVEYLFGNSSLIDGTTMKGMRKFSIVLSFFNSVIKGFLLFYLFRVYQQKLAVEPENTQHYPGPRFSASNSGRINQRIKETIRKFYIKNKKEHIQLLIFCLKSKVLFLQSIFKGILMLVLKKKQKYDIATL